MILNLLLVGIGVYLIVQGVYSAIKGKNLSKKEDPSAKKYTPESYAKCNRITGVVLIIVGLLFILLKARDYFFPELIVLRTVCYIGVGVCIVVIILLNLLLLKKVDTEGAAPASDTKNSVSDDDENEQYIDED